MAECSKCGEEVSMPFTCKFCGEKFCSDHRLPENHECSKMKKYLEAERRETIIYDAVKMEKEHKEMENEGFTAKASRKIDEWKHNVRRFLNPENYNNNSRRPNYAFGAVKQSFPEVATFGLLGVVVIGFILQIFIPGFTSLFSLVPSQVVNQPWRLVTTIFLHAGTTHLLVNSMVLFFFGAELEKRIGTARFLKMFFVSGIIASIGYSLYVTALGCSSGNCAAVGASGALYSVFAALAMIAPEIRVLAFFVIPMGIRTALVLFAFFDLFLLTQNTPIASVAHLTGLVVGLYYGYRLRKTKNYNSNFYF